MANMSCLIFSVLNISKEEVGGSRVIEVGSYDVAGSLRPIIESWNPAEYIGVDLLPGPGVDIVCRAEEIVHKFGKESFDLVISTEVIEHTQDWKNVISNIKNICKPKGIILISTRSFGYGYHAYPYDFWRYELEDMEEIFADCEIISLEKDPQSPGVFIKVVKPIDFVEKNLANYMLYSIVVGKKSQDITDKDIRNSSLIRSLFKEKIINLSKYILSFLTGGSYRVVLIRDSPGHEKSLARHLWEFI